MGRLQFWIWSIILGLAITIIYSLDRITGHNNEILIIIMLILLVAQLVVLANRIENHGSNPWIALFALIPVVNIAIAIYFGTVKYGKNKIDFILKNRFKNSHKDAMELCDELGEKGCHIALHDLGVAYYRATGTIEKDNIKALMYLLVVESLELVKNEDFSKELKINPDFYYEFAKKSKENSSEFKEIIMKNLDDTQINQAKKMANEKLENLKKIEK